MDLKPYIVKAVSDADLRAKFLRHIPNMFDDYFLTETGEVLTDEEMKSLSSLNYFINGLDMVSQAIRA